MSIEVVIHNDLWEEDSAGVISNWLASDGAHIAAGALLVEVMVEKTQYEIEAPVSGVLKIVKAEDEVVQKGDVIAQIQS